MGDSTANLATFLPAKRIRVRVATSAPPAEGGGGACAPSSPPPPARAARHVQPHARTLPLCGCAGAHRLREPDRRRHALHLVRRPAPARHGHGEGGGAVGRARRVLAPAAHRRGLGPRAGGAQATIGLPPARGARAETATPAPLQPNPCGRSTLLPHMPVCPQAESVWHGGLPLASSPEKARENRISRRRTALVDVVLGGMGWFAVTPVAVDGSHAKRRAVDEAKVRAAGGSPSAADASPHDTPPRRSPCIVWTACSLAFGRP